MALELGRRERAQRDDLLAGGARILDGIRENRANIFTHPDHKEELREIFDEILADYRDYPQDTGYGQRIAFEKVRRDGFAETRRKAREMR